MATVPERNRTVRHTGRWFDVRRRKPGMWAYVLNRITGIGLVVYLYLHLAVLSMLARGQSAWDGFVALARSPLFLTLDVILLAGILIHGLNGIRLLLMSFGVGLRFQRAMFGVVMVLTIGALGVATLKIYGG